MREMTVAAQGPLYRNPESYVDATPQEGAELSIDWRRGTCVSSAGSHRIVEARTV